MCALCSSFSACEKQGALTVERAEEGGEMKCYE